MKKIILGIVFVFASFTLVNANVQSEDECAELADAVAASVGIAIGGYASYGDYLDVWLSVDTACTYAAIENFEEIDPE